MSAQETPLQQVYRLAEASRKKHEELAAAADADGNGGLAEIHREAAGDFVEISACAAYHLGGCHD